MSATKRNLLPAVWSVPDVFRQRLGSTVGRQRLMAADGHLLLVLHLPPKPDESARRGRFLWRDAAGVWHGSDTGTGVVAVRKHLDEYAEVLERYEQLESQAAHADQYLELVEGLSPLVRSTRNQHTVFQQAREQCPQDRDLIDFRDAAYELERQAELLYDDAKNAMDVAVVRRAEEQAAASHQLASNANRLNMLAAFFLPLATISSVFGSGLTNGFEERDAPLPFLVMVAAGLFAGIVLVGMLRRSRTAGR